MMILLSVLAICSLVAIHLVVYRLRFLDVIPRSRVLSVAGGMSVAYVFLRILPELDRAQTRIGFRMEEALHVPRDPVYLVALLGLSVFYGLERLAERSRYLHQLETGENTTSAPVFWLHISSYSLVNFLIGYLVVERERLGLLRGLPFFVAMALYFVVNDYGLMVQHRGMYRSTGRWVLALSLLLGWLLGQAIALPDLAVSLALAFVGGGVIFNVMKEELPRERESRFWAFALGVFAYSALLLLA